jgi:glycosyltransferase involved in cell wall biosynthesis
MLGWWTENALSGFHGIPVHRCPEDPDGATKTLIRHIGDLRPQFVIALGDVPWLSYLATGPVQEAVRRSGTCVCLYFPIDGVLPNQLIPAQWAEILRFVHIPITMSKFGLSAVSRMGIKAVCIPHGCDTEVFKPPRSKQASKRRFGYQNKFVVLTDARNHRRKLLPRLLDIAHLLRSCQQQIVFHLHTNVVPEEDRDVYDYNLRADIRHLGLERNITLPSKPIPWPANELAEIYAAADVHLLTSYGEGFGLPTLQAASAGVVPLACLHSANTELVGQHGFAIASEASTQDEFGIVRHFIDRRNAAAAIGRLATNKDLLDELSAAARKFAFEYTWDRMALRWDALLQNSKPTHLPLCRQASVKFATPSVERKDEAVRPTGHSGSILPIPRLGIPARVGRNDSNLIIAPRKLTKRLAHLEEIFPGLSISSSEKIAAARLSESLHRALLVVDPNHLLHPDIDLACALAGVSFVGRSSIWPPIGGRNLYLKARALLTDITLAETRLQAAKRKFSEREKRIAAAVTWEFP